MYISSLCGLFFFIPLIYDCLYPFYITFPVLFKDFALFFKTFYFFNCIYFCLSLPTLQIFLKHTITHSDVYFYLNLSLLNICNHFLNRGAFKMVNCLVAAALGTLPLLAFQYSGGMFTTNSVIHAHCSNSLDAADLCHP